MAIIDVAAYREREAQGLITCRLHPTHDLSIWNYTVKCQFERAWDEVTLQARGLITKSDGTIVSRCMKKFFNYEEYQDLIPSGPFKVTRKFDGSLGILYLLDGIPSIATRGSFTSEQAVRGTRILHERYRDYPFSADHTYLFEIVYPQNRIVVDYGEQEDLVLLAVIHTATGNEVDIHHDLWQARWYSGIEDIAALRQVEQENAEGFVLHFQSGLRIKMKFAEYVRLHAIVTQCTARTIWQYLKESKSLSELLERVPDEFMTWVRSISRELSEQYRALHRRTHETYKEIVASASIPTPIPVGERLSWQETERIRKAMDRYIHEQFGQHPDIAPFLDILHSSSPAYARAKLEAAIWDLLYPAASRPFRMEGEDAA